MRLCATHTHKYNHKHTHNHRHINTHTHNHRHRYTHDHTDTNAYQQRHTNTHTHTHTHTDTIAAGDWQGAEAVELKDTRGTDTRVGPSLISKAKKRHRAKGRPGGPGFGQVLGLAFKY